MIRALVFAFGSSQRRNLTTCAMKNSKALGKAVADSNTALIPTREQDSEETQRKWDDDDEDDELENMFVTTTFNDTEYGGPLRGGRLPEPTRFGDWERKGRCTDY